MSQVDESQLISVFIKQLRQFAKNGHRFENGKTLRAGTQEEAIEGFTAGLEQGHEHGHFEIPTGVGKTATFIALTGCFNKAAEIIGSNKRTLIVVPSTDLVIQTAQALAKFMPDIAKLIEADDDNNQAIDWENSEIGAQYSKLKHAGKKPKVLITTYQSLAKDQAHKVYSPEEYGFIVYDEGHYITGDQFSRSVAKFKNSVQLAVTATREYSEDKNVQRHLAYEYYRLPIKDAIERGDLCNVHPILVNTDFTIDQDKFDSFIQQNNGRPLTAKQKQDLFNQKTRNQAIVETYLLGKDNETAESYFGQTGLIFAGGIDHSTDLKNQFNAAIHQEEYKPLKQWLEKQGVALIAEIHSKTKGEELTIDGKKRFYTKDEIKNLHRQGKILLLSSDQELKQGTDFPADSIIMDLVDRYSWVDTKQRYGRGYRLNPDDLGKTCKVFNFVDKNTKEIYGDLPELLPIYCAETLEGVQFKKIPSRHAFRRFKQPPPTLEDALRKSSFELITDIERVKRISADYSRIRKEHDYPGKTDDWLNRGEICKTLGIAYEHKKFTEFWENALTGKLEIETPLRLKKLASRGSPAWNLHKDDIPKLREIFGIGEAKTNDWLIRDELTKALHTTQTNPKFIAFWEQVTTGKLKLNPPLKVKFLSSGGHRRIPCVHISEVERCKKHSGLGARKTDDWLNRNEMAKALGIGRNNEKFVTFWNGTMDKSLKVKPAFKAEELLTSTIPTWCVHKSEVPRARDFLGLGQAREVVPKKPGWLGKTEFALAIKVQPGHDKIKKIWNVITTNLFKFNPPLKIELMRAGTRADLCIHKSEVERVEKKLPKILAVETDNPPSHAAKVAKGSLKPDYIKQQKANRGGWAKGAE